MKWLKQLSQAIDYIENNLTGDISYDEAAKIACCSTYYFQRMFSYVAGIPLSDYIRRRRMTKAAFELQVSEAKVMDIGSKYGYVSPTSFNRAFQKVHGVAPSVARRPGTILNSYPPISFSIKVTGGESMRYRIETKDPIRIVAVRTALQEDQEQNFQVVPKFWDKTLKSNLVSEISKLTNQPPHGILGVTVYENPEEIYYYIASSTDKAASENLVEYEIPAATWVIFECNEPFQDSIQTIFKRFLTEWLPFSGYEYAQLPDIEVYPVSNKKLKGRVQNPLSIAVTILQPLIWLVLYSAVAGETMKNTGISNYTAFILPGLIVLVTFGACCSGGMINFIMKSSGSFFRVLIAPVSRSSIVLGQILEAILVSFVEVAILFAVSLFFSVKVASGIAGIALMILLIFMTAFFMSSLAYYISLFLPNEVIYETIMTAIVLPIFFLSSALFPVENLSGVLKVAVMLNPFTHIINALRSLIFGKTILFGDILPVIALFAVMCCGSFALAKWRLKKETAH